MAHYQSINMAGCHHHEHIIDNTTPSRDAKHHISLNTTLAEILTAIRLYTGDPPTLIAFMREQADDLEAELPEMDATAEVEAGRPR